ncbi:amidase family protein, partial [Chlamydiota bacterium]
MCGVLGVKPTYGRVSRYGLIAFASSLDQIGPIANSVDDAACLLQIIAGHDPKDSTSVNRAVPDFETESKKSIKELVVGIPKEFYALGIDPEISTTITKTKELLCAHGVKVIDVTLPHTEYAVATYYIIATAEASSNLARYDGVQYERRALKTPDLRSLYEKTRSEGFGKEVKRRIILGTYVLSSGYYDAYYLKAQKVRSLIKADFTKVFKECDCILAPTTPTTAFRIGEKMNDPLQMYLSDIFTISTNLAGIPGISLPVALSKEKLPLGIQLLGNYFEEATLFNLARYIEKEFGFFQYLK